MIIRKHYKAIAEIIRHVVMSTGEETILAVPVANELADYFEQDNPRFNRDRFMKACGL